MRTADGAGGGAASGGPGIQEIARLAAAARGRIRDHLVLTPVEQVRLGLTAGHPLLVKAEHRQVTGSFKARGALARLTAAGGGTVAGGIVAASSGNHGLGVAHALSVTGGRGLVVVPDGASPAKVAAIRTLGVEVRHLGTDGLAAETAARALAGDLGWDYVSPYNDPLVIAGQATIGLELVEQVQPAPDAVVVAVGGGGLVSGIAAAVHDAWPATRIVGASPRADAAMAASVGAGRVVDVDAAATLSDGTAGGLEADTVTLALCAALVDEWVLVPEDGIAAALRELVRVYARVEGAAAVAFAAAAVLLDREPGLRVLVVSCGGNVAQAVLDGVLRGEA